MQRSLKARAAGSVMGVAAAVALALSGCSSNAAQGDIKPIADPQSVSGTVNVLTWEGASDPLKAVIPVFEKKYPKLKVKLQVIGYDDVSTRLTVGLQSGSNLPDVVAVTGERVKTVTGNFPDGFVDLRKFGLDKRKTEWAASKWPALTGADGELYGVPWDVGPVALYYRTDLLAEAGVDPSSIKTWEDYMAAGRKLKAQGHALLPIEVDTSQAYSILLQQQGQSYFTAKGKANLASEASISAATLLQNAVQDGYAKNVNNWDAMLSSLKSGEAATNIMPVWFAGILSSSVPEQAGKWAVMEMPALTAAGPRASNQGGSNLLIPAKSKNPRGAYLFSMFALGTTESANTMMKVGNMSSLLAASDQPAFKEKVPYYGDQQIWSVFAKTIPDIPSVPFTADYDKADQVLVDAMNKVLVSGADAKSTLRDANAQLSSQIGQ